MCMYACACMCEHIVNINEWLKWYWHPVPENPEVFQTECSTWPLTWSLIVCHVSYALVYNIGMTKGKNIEGWSSSPCHRFVTDCQEIQMPLHHFTTYKPLSTEEKKILGLKPDEQNFHYNRIWVKPTERTGFPTCPHTEKAWYRPEQELLSTLTIL